EYQERRFGGGTWRRKQQAQPFDMDCYTTTVFHKWAEDDWSYHCVTWQHGRFWVPVHPRLRYRETDYHGERHTLVEVMDRVHHLGTKYPAQHWLQWKAARPQIFGLVRQQSGAHLQETPR
ncbi:hypothetical protein ACWD4N_47670, partial [Streptomyces sp. NPDC002586]